MKAAVVVANEDVQYLDYEEPQAGPGMVKVKVKPPASVDLISPGFFIMGYTSTIVLGMNFPEMS